MPMFDGVEVRVIHMDVEVGFTPNKVLPIAPLPNVPFAAGALNGGSPLTRGTAFREAGLDESPAQRETGVAWR